MYKIVFVGLGSIGKRHIKNLTSLLKKRQIEYRIDAVRSSDRELPMEVKELISKEYHGITELKDDYDIAFITNPTSLHYQALCEIQGKARHLFVEKPLFANGDVSGEDFTKLKEGLSKGVTYIACPLRYKECMQYVKAQIDEGLKVISARAISSSYLPDWRKGVDYREVYSAKSALGGGVTLDLIHEWDYLTYFWGFPEKIYHIKDKVSDLTIDADDLSVYIAKYQDKVVEVHLDYFGRKSVRTLELYTDKNRIDVDIIANTVTVFENGTEQKITFETKDFYVSEMEYFLDLLEGKEENHNSLTHAFEVLKLVLQ